MEDLRDNPSKCFESVKVGQRFAFCVVWMRWLSRIPTFRVWCLVSRF